VGQSDVAVNGRPRLRELGLAPGILPPGPLNAITDVAGVRVGHVTRRDGADGPFNTGVTAILPHEGDLFGKRVPAAFEVLNGSGEVYGREFVDEMGILDSPIMLTGSLNVARVADAVITETIRLHPEVGTGDRFVHPFVAECSDAYFSDLGARPIGPSETVAAWHDATDGAVPEGCVGAGTGLVSFEFKAGIGSASRRAEIAEQEYAVGVLVSTNTGVREQLRIDGVPVGRELDVARPSWVAQGSIVIVVATDAPLLPRQLRRLAKRGFLGLARTGAMGHNGSGDFALAFSTANRFQVDEPLNTHTELDNSVVSPLFDATCEATEEAIWNALCAAYDFSGRNGNWAPALPLDDLIAVLTRYGHMPKP
jgi:D-aminopeptidase